MPHWQRNWSPVEPLSLKYSTLISWVHKSWSAQFEKLAIQVPKLIRLEKYSNYDFGRHLNVDGLAVLDTHSGCHKSLVSIPSLVCNSIWRKKKRYVNQRKVHADYKTDKSRNRKPKTWVHYEADHSMFHHKLGKGQNKLKHIYIYILKEEKKIHYSIIPLFPWKSCFTEYIDKSNTTVKSYIHTAHTL